MLEKCNPHTLRARFDMLDFWECWKNATLTHGGHFLTSCWTFGNAGKVQPSHTFGWGVMLDFWECWKSATLTHFGHFLTSFWMLEMLEQCNTHTLLPPFNLVPTWPPSTLCNMSCTANHIFLIYFLECWKSATLSHTHTHTLGAL